MFAKTRRVSRRRQFSLELLEGRQLLCSGIIEIDIVANHVAIPMDYFSLGGATPTFTGNIDVAVLNATLENLGSAYQFAGIGGSSNWSGAPTGGTLSLSGGIYLPKGATGSRDLTITESEGGFNSPGGFSGTLASSSTGNFNDAGVGNFHSVDSMVNTITTPTYVIASKNTGPDPEGGSASASIPVLTLPYSLTNSISFSLTPNALICPLMGLRSRRRRRRFRLC